MTEIRIPASREYSVWIRRGLLDRAGERVAAVTGARRAALVGDERVLSLHGARAKASLEAAGLETAVCSFPGGEQGKTLETYGAVMNFLAERRLERTDVLVALGGGVTGDLGGFAAATYQRGMRLAQIPTTLLAAVDSSVGGKTGVDLASGKNLCGCFYQPDLVLCDPEVLTTLPPEVFRDGCAEVIKYGLLGSEEFFHSLESTPVESQLETVIARCVAMKRDIVAEDEFDLGRRQLLNLGHTVGHAVEARSHYSVSHGCAVAIGMAVVARGAAAMGICSGDTAEAVVRLLRRYGLPTETAYSGRELYEAALSDKKIRGGKLHLVVPEAIGRCRVMTMEPEKLRDWLEAGGVRWM